MANTKISKGTFCLADIRFCGKPCKNIKVTEISVTDNVAVNCTSEDGLSYDATFLDDGKPQCARYLVECLDNGACGASEEIEIKFCNEGDCGPCQRCENGICVSLCQTNETCVNGQCIPTCGPGFIATNTGCECPSGIIEGGRCLECDETTELETCQVCVNGYIETKYCEGGLICDNETGDCICPEGFLYDPRTSTCVPKPECTSPEDCGECQDCVNGKCVDRVCPDGYICVPGLNKCLPECDCSTRDCSNGSSSCANHPTLEGRCYCHNCGDSDCTQEGGECGPTNDRDACICNNGGCQPNPCNGVRCSTGIECGVGCYCDNGECKPCSSLSCTDRDNPGGCHGSVDSAWRCQCDPNSGNCVGNPNPNPGPGGPGAPGSSNGPGCPYQVNLTKNDNDCSVTATLNKECCPCPNVCTESITTPSFPSADTFRIGNVTTFTKFNCGGPRFKDTDVTGIALNEDIFGGAIRYELTQYNIDGTTLTRPITDLGVLGSTIPAGSSTGEPIYSRSTSTASTVILQGVHSFVIKAYRLQFDIRGANCSYPEHLIDEAFYTRTGISSSSELPLGPVTSVLQSWEPAILSNPELAPRNTLGLEPFQQKTLSNNQCGNILTRWDQRGSHIRELYISGNTDTISYETSGLPFGGVDQRLVPCEDVTAYMSCACGPQRIDTDFCKPDRATYIFDECKRNVQITIPRSCSLHVNNNTQYVVLVNGVEAVRGNVALTAIDAGNYDAGEIITKIEFKLVCENGREICNLIDTFETDLIELPRELLCTPGVATTGVSFTFPTAPTGTIFTIEGVNYSSGDTYTQQLEAGVSFITVDISGPCVNDETAQIRVPQPDDCIRRPRVTDPCSCDSFIEFNNILYFEEEITYFLDGIDLSTFDVTSITGNLVDSAGNSYSAQEIEDLIRNNYNPATGLSVITLWIDGQYSIDSFGQIQDSLTEELITLPHESACSFTCCCNVTRYEFKDNTVCEGDEIILEITGREECSITFGVYEQGSRNFVQNYSLNFNGTSTTSTQGFAFANLPAGEYYVVAESSTKECDTLPDTEAGITIFPRNDYDVILESCTVVDGGAGNKFRISVRDNGTSLTSGVTLNPAGALHIGNGVYEGVIPPNTTVTVTIESEDDCRQKEYPITINCDCDSVTGGGFSPNTFCPQATTLQLTAEQIVGYTATFSSNTVNVDPNTGLVTNPTDGTITVTYTNNNNGCVHTVSDTISQSNSLTVTINEGNITACPGETVTLSVSNVPNGATITWSDNGANILTNSGQQSQSISIPNPALFDYVISVVVTDANGCTGNNTITISEGDCAGGCNCAVTGIDTCDQDGSLGEGEVRVYTTGPDCNKYNLVMEEITTGTSLFFVSENNIVSPTTLTGGVAGASANVYLQAKDGSGCNDKTGQSVLLPNCTGCSHTVNFTEDCTNPQFTVVTANVTGGVPNYTYSWNTGSTSSSVNIDSLGTATLILVVTDANGCSKTFTYDPTHCGGCNCTPELFPQNNDCDMQVDWTSVGCTQGEVEVRDSNGNLIGTLTPLGANNEIVLPENGDYTFTAINTGSCVAGTTFFTASDCGTPPPEWNCINGQCVSVSSGPYASEQDCLDDCGCNGTVSLGTLNITVDNSDPCSSPSFVNFGSVDGTIPVTCSDGCCDGAEVSASTSYTISIGSDTILSGSGSNTTIACSGDLDIFGNAQVSTSCGNWNPGDNLEVTVTLTNISVSNLPTGCSNDLPSTMTFTETITLPNTCCD